MLRQAGTSPGRSLPELYYDFHCYYCYYYYYFFYYCCYYYYYY